MAYPTLGYRLPSLVASPLFGDRAAHGLTPDATDRDWIEWEKASYAFYHETQRRSVGALVNDAGYRILRRVDLTNKRVLEIGPGELRHLPYWVGRPAEFTIADIRPEMLSGSARLLSQAGVATREVLLRRDQATLPFEEGAFDVVLSFYALEHIHPLAPYLDDVGRVMRKGGVLAGAIPCEGGLAWGMGRFFTSRRWLKRNANIDPDKIICWEHPNFADMVLNQVESRFQAKCVRFWPFAVPLIDMNLVASFIYEKP